MSKKELASILTFYAISPIHAGSGSMIGAIDLPIQRERHTNWPHIQASSVKGALRDHFRSYSEDRDLINFIFGLDKENDAPSFNLEESIPGAISVSDAKLLAFPVRSNIAPFVWITCPSILMRLCVDLTFTGLVENAHCKSSFTIVNKEKYRWIINKINYTGESILLEDVVLEKDNTEEIKQDELLNYFPKTINRLLLVPDEIFTYLVETATEVQTQIKIDSNRGTTKDGSLRYQELLPSDTVLYSVIYFKKFIIENNIINNGEQKLNDKIKDLNTITIFETVKKYIKYFIQIGGDETLGRGICAIQWYPDKEGSKS